MSSKFSNIVVKKRITNRQNTGLTDSNGEPITPRGNFMLPTRRVPYINPGLKIIPEEGGKIFSWILGANL